MGLLTTPRTWVSGEIVTAGMLNTEVRDAIAGLQVQWETWSPTFGGLTVGNAVVVARFYRVGKSIVYRLSFTAGSTTTFTAGATLTFTLPAPLHGTYGGADPIGTVFLLDASAGSGSRSGGTAFVANATTAAMVADRVSPGTVTQAVPWAWAQGDVFSVVGTYEAV